ncbi:MAG: glycosyltransferase [Coriobacteriia bacterium]|nr:glycosyltransferase [Coriobacteriia bacterium]
MSALDTPLAGARICLVASNTLMFHRRFLLEMQALEDAGAYLRIVGFYEDSPAPPGKEFHPVPLNTRRRPAVEELVPAGSASARGVRSRVENTALGIARRLAYQPWVRKPVDLVLGPEFTTTPRTELLQQFAPNTDIFWAVDYLNLENTSAVAARSGVPLVYETIDLIPEYDHLGPAFSRRARKIERNLMSQVAGFVTACDGYADYYEERYGDIPGFRRPVVHDNAPEHSVPSIRPTGESRRFLFLGALTFDRPIVELIEACAAAGGAVDLTFQGEDYLGDAPRQRIADLGLGDRVRIVEPCSGESIVETAAAYDVGIVALRGRNENERRATTTKLLTYMAAGLAVIGSDLPGISHVVSTHKNGRLVDEAEHGGWASALVAMSALPALELDDLKRRSLAGSADHSWAHQRPVFVEEFRRVLR